MAEYDICHIKKSTMKAIADSVRAKTGKTGSIPGKNLPSEIQSIVTTGNAPTGTLKITKNDIYNVTEYAAVDVDVPIPDEYVPEGTVPEGYMPIPTEELQIVNNGPYDVLNFARIVVDVPVNEFVEEWDGSFTIVITFAVGAATLQAEKGMTWEEWLTSDYKADDIIADGTYITVSGAPSGLVLATQDGTAVTLNDEIISSHVYTTIVLTSTISFSIGDISFTANEGDTWEKWITSDYNNDEDLPVVAAGNLISVASMESGYALHTSDGVLVKTDHNILSGHQYTLKETTDVLISFAIGDTSFTANAGSMWDGWLTSDYNNDEVLPVVKVGNWISVATMESGYALYTNDGVLVKADDWILSDYQYTLKEIANETTTFTIGSLSLTTKVGDTWEEWIATEYNTLSAAEDEFDNYVSIGTLDGAIVLDSNGTPVKVDEYVLTNHPYTIKEVVTFTVDGTTFKAWSGDTWKHWVTTSYNSYNFGINSSTNYVMNSAGSGQLYTADGSYVNAIDTIVDGHAYTFSTM